MLLFADACVLKQFLLCSKRLLDMIPNNWYKTLNPKTGSHLLLKLVRLTVSLFELIKEKTYSRAKNIVCFFIFHFQLFFRQADYRFNVVILFLCMTIICISFKPSFESNLSLLASWLLLSPLPTDDGNQQLTHSLCIISGLKWRGRQ